jgi:CRP-like cAMP-binding protein
MGGEKSVCLSLIAASSLFAGVSIASLGEMLEDGRTRIERFKPGEIVFGASKNESCLGIFCEGKAQVEKLLPSGQRVLMSVSGPGDVFGTVTLFAKPSDFPTVIRSEEACTVVLFERETVRGMFQREPSLAENMIAYLSSRILFLNRRIEGFAATGAEEKLAVYLRDNLMKTDGKSTLSLSMTDLAETLSVGRASLYRAFDRLEAMGLIVRRGKTVDILDKEGFQKLFDNN